MNRDILDQPFGPEQIKQREGNFGKTLDYIEGHAVIQRLNDAFDADWSFSIIRHDVLNDTDEVLVLGELKAGSVVKTQFGSSRITRARESGEIVSLADDLKAAATDALKKAATLLGVGLHLYRNDRLQSGNRESAQQNNGFSRESNGNGGYGRNYNSNNHSGNGNGYKNSGNGNGNGRITAKQHSFILSLLKNKGITKNEINQKCVDVYGSVLDYLSRTDASNLISELQS